MAESPTPARSETIVRMQDGLHFVATTPTGFTVDLDSRLQEGEAAVAPSPMEMQLIALGACGAMDTISILRKMRQDVTSYEVRLSYTRAAEHPRVYTSVHMLHVFQGKRLVEANVRRAMQLTMVRYCPVYAMLHPTVDISERYEIFDDDTGQVAQNAVTPEDEEGAPAGPA